MTVGPVASLARAARRRDPPGLTARAAAHRPERCERSPPLSSRACRAHPCGAVRSGPWPGWATRHRCRCRTTHGVSRHPGVACRVGSSSRTATVQRWRPSRSRPSLAVVARAGWTWRRGRSRRGERQPRPVGDARRRLAERQPQRQQHALPRGRDRPVPPRRRRPEAPAPTRSGSSTTSPPGGHKAYDFLARYNGWVSPPMCGVGWRRRLVDVPVAAGGAARPRSRPTGSRPTACPSAVPRRTPACRGG